jgi:hypothetical protein
MKTVLTMKKALVTRTKKVKQSQVESKKSSAASKKLSQASGDENDIEVEPLEEPQRGKRKEAISLQLTKTETALKETTAILWATQHTEACLASLARELIDALKKSICDGNEMHQLLLRKRDDDVKRRAATKDFNDSVVAGSY